MFLENKIKQLEAELLEFQDQNTCNLFLSFLKDDKLKKQFIDFLIKKYENSVSESDLILNILNQVLEVENEKSKLDYYVVFQNGIKHSFKNQDNAKAFIIEKSLLNLKDNKKISISYKIESVNLEQYNQIDFKD